MQKENSKDELKIRAYTFAVKIVRFLDGLPRDYITETLGKQLIRSSTSIGANVVEAQAASSKKDFTNFLSYALKSSNETLFWLCLLRDTRYKQLSINLLIEEVKEFSKILGSSILTLRGKRGKK